MIHPWMKLWRCFNIVTFMDGCFCVLIGTVVLLQMCDCGAYKGQSRKHYFNHSEESLMMTPMECRNM